MATQAIESDTKALVDELKRDISGEVRFDKMSRILYSTDAMMCRSRFVLIWSIIVAREVVLPEPVGPVTMYKPRGRRISSLQIMGRPISSNESS